MSRFGAEQVVEFLSFSRSAESTQALKRLNSRQWNKVLQWLADAGLPFYFLQKLKGDNATDVLPAWVLVRLENDLAANRLRFAQMSHRFDLINRQFSDAGIEFAVLKGFSLVPEFCPDAQLRHQSDFDYLIDDASLENARQVLIQAGYIPRQSRSSRESIFVMPGAIAPSRGAEQYSARAPHAVELHLDVWDGDLHRVPSIPRLFSVETARAHQWNGFTFPALDNVDGFLAQVLHVIRHLFAQWTRMSSLFEIGYFLNRHASDTALWSQIEQCTADNQVLREFAVIVVELVSRLFAAPIPPLVRVWGTQIRPAPRVWIDNYARDWAFCEFPVYQFRLFPTSRFAWFLHRQYVSEKAKPLKGTSAPPASRLSRMALSIKNNPSLIVNTDWWKRQLLVQRSAYHALAWLRYLSEIPRWLWLNRAAARPAPPAAWLPKPLLVRPQSTEERKRVS